MALDRDGDGYDPELAKHYLERYEVGVQRMMKRRNSLQYAKTTVMGSASVMGGQAPGRARLGWQYGRQRQGR